MLYIIRGLPGSGKSTLARLLLEALHLNGQNAVHLETDMYFYNEKGDYLWEHGRLEEAHSMCKQAAATSLEFSTQVNVIVSNTFVRWDHIQPYVALANKWGHEVQIIECKGKFKNIHDVPEHTIKRMEKQWEEIELNV